MPDPGLTDKWVRVDPLRPDPGTIQRAAKILTQNRVVIFPAQCLYGVAANALNPDAVEAVFRVKQRPKDNPILVLIRDRAALNHLAAHVPERARRLMDRFWPGNLTLVFKAAPHISPKLSAHTGKIGIRLPAHPVARALVNAVDFPVTGTSANISGRPGCIRPDQLPPSIVNDASLILDAGEVAGGTGSTIADVTEDSVRILRQGVVPAREIFKVLA